MAGESPYGIPRSLLSLWPERRTGEWTLRLGDVPELARHCPHLMEREVPLDEVRWACGILSRPSCKAAASPVHNLRHEPANVVLERAQEAVARALALSIPGPDDEQDGGSRGMGWWLGLYHFALAGLHLGRAEAMEAPVGELMALSAANYASMGGKFGGPTYEERDMLEELEGEGAENV